MRIVSEKMGVKPGSRAFITGAPEDARSALMLPPLFLTDELHGLYSYLHQFVTMGKDLDTKFPILRRHLAGAGMLWISWPKGKQLKSDLSLPQVIRIGYSHGLVESKTISVNSTWSAIKFTHPRPGQQYNNSYGTLAAQTERVTPKNGDTP